MFGRRWTFLLAVLAVAAPSAAFAVDVTSPNYQNYTSTFAPAVIDESSSNFKINGSIEPIVGLSQSPNFKNQHGIPLPVEGTTAASAGTTAQTKNGKGAETGKATPSATQAADASLLPTLEFKSPTFMTHRLVYGEKPSLFSTIRVNGSSNNVVYPSPSTWQRDLPLFLGFNQIVVEGVSASAVSRPVVGTLERWLVGDCNDSHLVDDIDLSLFSRIWNNGVYKWNGDFNEDGFNDDSDLSMLAAHWLSHF